ncbi:MAG: ParB/RepB/Spo0J family partition protein [Firmicutes bacterium]|nr:ParB/RepB/Spo0J family partition protein [Bacillota bacterium]
MTGKRRLGRGLGALIPETIDGGAALREIDIGRISRNPFQPRVQFDQEKLQELADSIREHGVVQPVIVTPGKDGYVLVAGERRLKAASLAGLQTIPALTRELDDKMMLQIALIENLQREDLNPIEEARAYHQLVTQFKLTQEKLARRLGKSRPAIANTMRLLSLSEEVKKALEEGSLTEGQARPLLRFSDKELQNRLARRIIREKLTAREVERLVSGRKKFSEPGPELKKEPRENMVAAPDPVWEEIREELQYHLGTKVKITQRAQGGTIEIEFYQMEDLERLLGIIMPGK